MSLEAKDMFARISDEKEKLLVFQELVQKKQEVVCKIASAEDIFHLVASRIDYGRELICILRKDSHIPAALPAKIIANFTLNADKYFFQSDLVKLDGGYYEVSIPPELFHLQRRQSFRIRITDNYATSLKIVSVNGNPFTLTGKVHDLSAGGCRMVLPKDNPEFKSDDIIDFDIAIGTRPTMRMTGKVRHVKQELINDKPKQVAGIEFQNMNSMTEGKIFAVVMELHRELFTSWLDR